MKQTKGPKLDSTKNDVAYIEMEREREREPGWSMMVYNYYY